MIDISIYESGSGGRIESKGADMAVRNSLVTEIYIALFGGQVEKQSNGYTETVKMEDGWFGNSQSNSIRWVNSYTEAALAGKVITPTMISSVEDAVGKDLERFEKYGEVTYSVSVRNRNRIEILISIEGFVKEYKFVWDSTINEVILAA